MDSEQAGSNVVSLAAIRASRRNGVPTPEEYRGLIFEWMAIARRLAPEDLALAVGDLRGWPVPPPARVQVDATVIPFLPRA